MCVFKKKCPWRQVTGDRRRRPRNQSLHWSLWPWWYPLMLTVLDNQQSYEGYAERWPGGLVGPNRPAEAMPFNGMVRRYSIIYIVNLFLLTNKSAAWFNKLYAQCCTQHLTHTGNYCQLFPRSPRLDIGMFLRRSSNGLIISAYAWFHPSCCWTKIAPPVPSCNSPFHVHSRLLCNEEHCLSVPLSLSGWLPTTTAQ